MERAFKGNVDMGYGMLNKTYASESGLKEAKRRYSPATMTHHHLKWPRTQTL